MSNDKMGQNNQLYWEDISVGTELPSLARTPNTKRVVMWAGAVDQYDEIHFDKDVALKSGFPGVILHGSMKGAFLMQMFTECIGLQGAIRRISWRHDKTDFPGKEIRCRAKAAKKYMEDTEALIDFDIWIENEDGVRTSSGAASIILPRR